MEKRTVVTNLRLDPAEWIQIKASASELDLSAHEYLLLLIRAASAHRELMGELERAAKREKAPVWDLVSLGKRRKQEKGLARDDEEIYR